MPRLPGRLDAFARIHPWYGDESVALLDTPSSSASRDSSSTLSRRSHTRPSEETLRLIRLAAEHGAPTLFHCGDEPMATPYAIAPAAAACPDATIILGHMGGYFHVDDAIAVAEEHGNVVLETSAMPYPAKDPRGGRAHRRLSASCTRATGPACSPRIEVEKVRLAGLDPADERLVFADNALRILDAVR